MSEPYEFDAPSYVVDLKELANTEVDDQWFGESPQLHSSFFGPQRHYVFLLNVVGVILTL